jgi:hypothetical protein
MASSDTSNQLRFAGDVNINKVKIITSRGMTQDVTVQVMGIEYYEDMFSPFVTGQIFVKDALALPNVLKFMGEEYVEIEFGTPTLEAPIKGTFYIHKMTEREQQGDRAVVYTLHFTSVEAVVDLNKKISKTFRGKISDTAEQLLKNKQYGLETEKRVNVEPTNTSDTFISSFWSPLKNLQWCCSKAKNERNVPNYVFFENKHGFNFVSLDSLYANASVQDFVNDKYTRDDLGDGRTAANPQEDYKRVLDISMPDSFGDTLEKLKKGVYQSRAMTFDITRKTYTAKNFNFYDKFERQQHLNPNPINSRNLIARPNAALLYRNRMESNFAGTLDNTNFTYIQERISTIEMAQAHRVEISVLGRTDYAVGQKVLLDLTKMKPIRETEDTADTIDRLFSGYYLISALNHSVTRQGHECHMELIKDSLAADPNSVGEL